MNSPIEWTPSGATYGKRTAAVHQPTQTLPPPKTVEDHVTSMLEDPHRRQLLEHGSEAVQDIVSQLDHLFATTEDYLAMMGHLTALGVFRVPNE